MTHVVTDNCNGCKYTDCVEVCPVECFVDAGQQLVINPEECIDCSACIAECPVEAIFEEYELPDSKQSALEYNAQQASQGQTITQRQDPLPTADERRRELGY